MNLERVLDRIESKLDAQDERFTEVISRLAVLESKNEGSRDGFKVVGWLLSFVLSIAAIVVSLSH